MKITDVIELAEAAYGAPGSRAMGTGNFALLHRTYVNKRPRLSRNLQLDFGNNQIVELDDDDIEAVANYYDSLPTNQDRYSFVYDVMSRGDKFNALLQKLGRRTGTAQQPNLLERDVKKNSSADLDRSSVRSAALSTALRQAYAKYPQAQSDIEALVMHDMDVQKNTGQELQAQNKINQRQDDIDAQLRDVARKQNKKISSLDQENDDLTAELEQLSRELDAMHAQTGTAPERKKDADKTDSTASKEPSTVNINVKSDDRAEKKQQRSADAEKRKPEPARLKPGSATFKPLGSTVPMVKPTAPAPMPTINVIDEPAVAQQPEPQPDMPLPTSFGQRPEPEQEPEQTDLFSPIPQSLSAPDAEEEPALPSNVSNLDQARRMRQATAQQARDAIKTGTFESQELRRMRELAGLSQ